VRVIVPKVSHSDLHPAACGFAKIHLRKPQAVFLRAWRDFRAFVASGQPQMAQMTPIQPTMIEICCRVLSFSAHLRHLRIRAPRYACGEPALVTPERLAIAAARRQNVQAASHSAP
jgi:hypothetical protein